MCRAPHAVDLIYALMVVCLLTLPLQATVKVMYPKQELNMAEGDSMTLKCVTVYQPEMCKELSVYWCKENIISECEPVSDPDRQLITMNETDDSELSTQRCRDVILQLRNITAKDAGSFQCMATCSASGATAAMGHIVRLTTHARTSAGPKTSSGGSNQPDLKVLVWIVVQILCLW